MKTLNPKLFINVNGKYEIIPKVLNKLKEIALAFVDYLEDEGVSMNVADIQLLGSNCGYDYTDKSDIDLHIVTDFEAISCDSELLQIALNAERTKFNTDHDITIKGIDVELYVEDVKAGTNSNGIYSILHNNWVKYPEPENNEMPEYESYLIQWKNIIDKALCSDNLHEVQRIINRLYMMRKNSLATQGRFSAGNLIFKNLRNEGLLDALKDKRADLESKKLSLESKLIIESLVRRK